MPLITTLAGGSAKGYGGLLGAAQISDTAFESIQTYTATSTVADVTFSSIPSTYKILQIRGICRADGSSAGDLSVFMQLNGDTTSSNYRFNRIYSYSGSNNKGIDYSANSNIFAAITLQNAATASDYAYNIIEIVDYADSNKTKQVKQIGGSSGSQFYSASLWTGTAAINSIKIFPGAGLSFLTYTQFALYGIKG